MVLPRGQYITTPTTYSTTLRLARYCRIAYADNSAFLSQLDDFELATKCCFRVAFAPHCCSPFYSHPLCLNITTLRMPGKDFKEISKSKRDARDREILNVANALFGGADHSLNTLNEYTSASAARIVQNIGDRKWSARAVVEAYIRRAIQSHMAVNCITEGESGISCDN